MPNWWPFSASRRRRDDAAQLAGVPLGIAGLPDEVGWLRTGEPAVLMWHDEAMGQRWMRQMLLGALALGPVMWLAQDERLPDVLLTDPALRSAFEEGGLRVWLLSASMATRMAAQGLTAMREVLQALPTDDDQTLFMAGDWLVADWQGFEQLELNAQRGRRLLHQPKRPAVWYFDASGRTPQDAESLQSLLTCMPHAFSQLAVLGAEQGREVLWLERWSGAHGPVFQTRMGVQAEGAQGLHYAGWQTQGVLDTLVEANDQAQVWVHPDAWPSHDPLPDGWVGASDMATLAEQAARAQAATVVLCAGRMADFKDLARAVHGLRVTASRTLKIVVRETSDKLRLYADQALHELGANAVVPKELPNNRLVQVVRDLRFASFLKPVQPDFEQAFARYEAAPARGYVPPARFVVLVRDMLQRSEGLRLSHSLLRLPLLSRVSHLQALMACHPHRDGDIITADASALYVFLYACEPSDVVRALSHFFSLPPELFLEGMQAYTEPDEREAVLRQLDHAARKGLPDYSGQVAPSVAEVLSAPEANPGEAPPQWVVPDVVQHNASGAEAVLPRDDLPPILIRSAPIRRAQSAGGDHG